MTVRLILHDGDGRASVDVPDGKYVLGRDNRADILVPNRTVSSRHAEIIVRGHHCTIRDLGSSNGTTVNGASLRGTRELAARDQIHLGSSLLTIADVDDGPPAAAGPLLILRGRKRLSWAASFWVAAAVPVALMCAVLIAVELYTWNAQKRRAQITRFRLLAAQYTEPLRPRVPDRLPPPVLDETLTQPVLVADASGKVLYPPSTAGSPLIDPKTHAVYGAARDGLFSVDVGGVEAFSYPVLAENSVLGYVVARPAAASNEIVVSILTIIITAAVALAIVYVAQKRLIEDMQRGVETTSPDVPNP